LMELLDEDFAKARRLAMDHPNPYALQSLHLLLSRATDDQLRNATFVEGLKAAEQENAADVYTAIAKLQKTESGLASILDLLREEIGIP